MSNMSDIWMKKYIVYSNLYFDINTIFVCHGLLEPSQILDAIKEKVEEAKKEIRNVTEN